jgi:hypothetical protein
MPEGSAMKIDHHRAGSEFIDFLRIFYRLSITAFFTTTGLLLMDSVAQTAPLKDSIDKIIIQLQCDKKCYHPSDSIMVAAQIRNNSSDRVTLLWSGQPNFRTFTNNTINIATYGWGDNLDSIALAPGTSIRKMIAISPDHDVPLLDQGSYLLDFDFRFNAGAQSHVSRKLSVKIEGKCIGLTNSKILKLAQKFLRDSRYEQKVDTSGVEINNHLFPSCWNVEFSNEGPVNFGVTSIIVDKTTGKASFPVIDIEDARGAGPKRH